MNKKRKRFQNDIVYSSENTFVKELTDNETATLPPEEQVLHLYIEKKGRAGKSVTIIKNFIASKDDLKNLATTLKSFFGVGGTIKNVSIEIQGDFRDRIEEKLKNFGYQVKKIGG